MASTPVAQANLFLAPVLDRTQLLSLRNASLIQRLSHSLQSPPPSTDTKTVTRAAIRHALSLLASIHTTPTPGNETLVNATEARTITCLLDLLVLEGIYPSLSHGVGIPLERRARNFVLPATAAARKQGRVQEVEENRDVELLGEVVSGLAGTLEGDSGGVGRAVRERCLVDVLAGCGELAFVEEGEGAGLWKERWGRLVDSTPTPSLLPALLSLLHPLTPPAFRKPLTTTLSTIPLHPSAIQHILHLFLSTISDSALSVDALTNASRIICAVPASVSPEAYFAKICPQLLECLDGKDAGLARAAGFVIAELLGKKGRIEGVIGGEIVRPIVSGLDPSLSQKEEEVVAATPAWEGRRQTSSALLAFEDSSPPMPRSSLIQEITDDSTPPLISESTLTTTLTRLTTLLTSHPSPSVPQRLLNPLLLPIWALLSYAAQTSRSTWHITALSLLQTHLKTTPTPANTLTLLQNNLLFTGSTYVFSPSPSGGIEARKRTGGGTIPLDIPTIDARVAAFLGLLEDVPEAALNKFFLEVLRGWLGRRNGEVDLVKMVAALKVLQGVVEKYEGVLAKAPTQTLQIVGGVLGEYVDYCEARKTGEVGGPSMGGLGNIVQGVEEDDGEEEERTETVMMALSLLSVLISQPGTKLTAEDERLIQTLHPPLRYLSTSPGINEDLSSLAVNIASLLSLHQPASSAPAPSSLADQQKESYALALSYLRDPLVPVRAHGLHLLRELVLARAPVVDVVGTMRLLVGMLRDGDSFVYLNVVKCLSALTERHGKTVTRMLVECYVDDADVEGRGRLGLDERLRVGEALLVTVQRLGGALVGETAELIGQSMLGIISRRRVRAETSPSQREAEDWGSDPEDDNNDEEAPSDPQTRARAKADRLHKAKIIKGWHPTNSTEDLRIRTSALSILGAAIETNAPGLGPRVLTEALSTALSVLTLETGAEGAIVRRAAAVCVGSVLKSLVGLGVEDGDGGAWRAAVWDVLKGRVGEVRRVLGYVRVSDSDGLVREQTGVVADNFEAVVERWMLGGGAQGAGGILEGGMGGMGGLRILG